jgi:hypothetical protein
MTSSTSMARTPLAQVCCKSNSPFALRTGYWSCHSSGSASKEHHHNFLC